MSSLALAGALVLPVGAGSAAASGGLFQPAVAITLPNGAEADAVAVGDATGDGRPDVVVTTIGGTDPETAYSMFVLAQGQDGLLEPPIRYWTGAGHAQRAHTVAVGDVTGDGRPDVLVGLDRVGINVYAGQADGSLQFSSFVSTNNSTWIRLGDVNADGRLDLVGIGWGSGTVDVMPSPFSPFTVRSYAVTHHGWDDLDLGDVDGDGNLDLVVMSGQGFGPNFSVLSGNGDGTFDPAVATSLLEQVNANGVGVGDTNGDGRDDIALSYGGNTPTGKVNLYVQRPDGTLDFPVTHSSYDIPESVEVADLDRDGREDVVTLHGGWLRAGVYLGREAGHLDQEQLYPIPSGASFMGHSLAIGDINGDGWLDVVAAARDDGVIVLSNSQVFQPTEPGAPNLTSAVADDGRVTLQWAAPTSDGGSAITSYYAEASPGGAYCLVSGLACQISGLTNGTTYSFTVRAGNVVGLGDASNVRTATPGVAPGVPRSFLANPNLQAGVGLSWQAPSSLGSPSLLGYRIYRGVAGGPLSLHATVNANAVSFTDTAVVNGGSYAYQVAAFSAVGEGPRTSVLAVQRGTAPSAPRTLAATVAAKAINLIWAAPSSNGGSAVTGYRIYRGTTSATKVLIASVSGSTLAYADKAITKKTRYFYAVTAVNLLGESLASNEASATAR